MMRPSTRALATLLLGFLAGCGSPLQVSYPQKSYFLIEAERTTPPAETPLGPALRIGRFRISPHFEDRQLVYRTGDRQYEHDFYNEFFDDPSRLIEEKTQHWLASSGLFESVHDAASPVLTDWLLDGRVQEIYADYRSGDRPQAVLAIQFFVLDLRRPEAPVRFERSLRWEGECAPGPDNLAAAWSKGLQALLTELEGELRQRLPRSDQPTRTEAAPTKSPSDSASRQVD